MFNTILLAPIGKASSAPHAIHTHHTAQLNRRAAGLPSLAEIGGELQQTSSTLRLLWPMLPLVSFSTFFVALAWHFYALLPVILFMHFVFSTTFTHDVVHGAAGLSPRQSDWALFGMSLLLVESGHAFRIAHLHHHSHCLEEDDFEGSPAHMSLLETLAAGPLYLLRHWQHAYRISKSPVQQRWMRREAYSAVAMLAVALCIAPWSIAPLLYLIGMYVGSCFYPLTTAWLPHYKPNNKLLGQARTLRGKIIPALLCNLTYHLEHHLYPQVPSYHLPQLAEKLDPHFVRLGVPLLRVV